MKKIIILCLVFIFILTGCTGGSEKLKKDVGSNNKYLFNYSYCLVTLEANGIIYISGADGGLAPYYSKNGKLCHYVDGEIEEID